ncbi:hypothetical protein GCM10007108_00560 [Thermogymnomonas acidicola]|uniref:Uncharacterized protein n=1 Tax=Thermogymnomonas acidicola TaxID=399579 RepID=A0AA37F8J3_9ARCH|nr:hypothetical protein [Thermogymnomonas acidicola]GGM66190.1 hypothetical protein GCM10007108_00560 [Thermogymnomonas acidicola]
MTIDLIEEKAIFRTFALWTTGAARYGTSGLQSELTPNDLPLEHNAFLLNAELLRFQQRDGSPEK